MLSESSIRKCFVINSLSLEHQGSHSGGKCPGGSCPGGKCPGGKCPGGKCPGGNCPGGKCPDTHMASISVAIRHSQGVTMQYIALSFAEKASITTRLAIAAYNKEEHVLVC